MQCCARKMSPGYGQIGWSSSRRPFLLWRDFVATTSSGFTRKGFLSKIKLRQRTSDKTLKGSVAAFDPIVRPRMILPGGLTREGKLTCTAVSDHLYGTRGWMSRVLVHQSKPKNDWFMSDSIVLEPHLDMKNLYFMTACCLILFLPIFILTLKSLFCMWHLV